MFSLAPDAPDMGDLKPLSNAIDTLCEILDGDRETVIEALAEILRRRAEFEEQKLAMDRRSACR